MCVYFWQLPANVCLKGKVSLGIGRQITKLLGETQLELE